MNNCILSCDWGTSSFRLRLVQINSGKILAETSVGKGIAEVNTLWLANGKSIYNRLNFYRDILQSAIHSLNVMATGNIPVYLSGMASSTIGMKALDYGGLPFDLSLDTLPHEKIPADEICCHDIILVSGLRSESDVMRGEETMLLGCKTDSADECLLIFPGTHSKHVLVRQNKLVGFSTFMTGEFFDLLANRSILSVSVKRSSLNDYKANFQQGLEESRNTNILNAVFHTRTNQLFNKMLPEPNFQYLSGLIIGSELNSIPGTVKNIILISGSELASGYTLALEMLGFGNRLKSIDAGDALVKGHLRLAV